MANYKEPFDVEDPTYKPYEQEYDPSDDMDQNDMVAEQQRACLECGDQLHIINETVDFTIFHCTTCATNLTIHKNNDIELKCDYEDKTCNRSNCNIYDKCYYGTR